MNEVVEELLDCLDRIANAWVDFFADARDVAILAGYILVWLLIALSSPVWVGPFLLWRKFRKGRLVRKIND